MSEADLSIDSPTSLVPATEPDPIRYNIEKETLVDSAIENRMEMLAVELQIAQDSSRVDYYKNQTLPLVSLAYSYQMNGIGPTRNDAYDMIYDQDLESHIVG